MTIRDRIVALLVAEPGLTNRQIATKLEIPEPSVRRSTFRLEHEAVIAVTDSSPSSVNMQWQMASANSAPVQEVAGQ